MKLRTQIPDLSYPFDLKHQHKLLMLGSCFTENIGNKLQNSGFDVFVNPYGINYNPASIADTLESIVNKRFFTESDLIFNQGQWHSPAHHSRFSSQNKTDILNHINEQNQKAGQFLEKTDYLMITFGTAYIFRNANTGQIVNNCHKLPANAFNNELLTADQITADLSKILDRILTKNPTIRIIFTVSPVRHLRSGFVGNQLSKSTLHLSVHQLLSKYTQASYFPSYEIVMDDLRDYRFYDKDLVHLSETAVDYIWEKFSDAFFSTFTKQTISKLEKLEKARNHRFFDAQSNAIGQFAQKNLQICRELRQSMVNLDKLADYEKYFNELT